MSLFTWIVLYMSSQIADAQPQTTSSAAVAPWQRSWFYHAPGEVITQWWILGLHAVAIAGIILFPFPPLGALAVAGVLIFLGGLGTTVCYHRALAHRAVALHPVIEQLLIFFAVFNGSGKPRTWVAMHRLHHATSDHPDDISSPGQGGFWWAHLRWLWQADSSRSQRFAHDLTAASYRFWDRAQLPILAVSFFGGLMWCTGGPMEQLSAWLWIGPIRLLWALHAQCTVNSVCHLGVAAEHGGSSRNVWWLAPVHMGQGENWHANHHRRQVDPRLGYGFFQVDIGWWAILTLRTVGLARCRAKSASAD